MFFGSGWLDLEDIKLICEQIFSFLKRCNCVALVIALQLAKEWLSMVAKQLKQKIIFYYTSRLSFSLARSPHHHHHPFFFFFCTLFSSKWLSALFIFQIWYLFGLLFLSYAFAFSWNMVGPVYCSIMRSTSTFFTKNNFKNRSQGTIYTFKNYFTTFKNGVHSASN